MNKVYVSKKFNDYAPVIENGKSYTDKIEIDQLRIHRRFNCLNYIIKNNRVRDVNLPPKLKLKNGLVPRYRKDYG